MKVLTDEKGWKWEIKREKSLWEERRKRNRGNLKFIWLVECVTVRGQREREEKERVF